MTILYTEIVYEGQEVTVKVEFSPGWFKRGNRSGHPDNWAEDEGEAAEIESVILEDENGKQTDITCNLTSEQRQKIQRECDNYEVEPDYLEYDDLDDFNDFDVDPNVDCGTDNYGRSRD